jgi:K+-sensing histidine kinase KdpD
LYAEQQIRKEEKKEHRRLSRVAAQLEAPIRALQEDLAYLTRKASTLPAEDRIRIKQLETRSAVLLENVRDVFLMMRALEGPVAQNIRLYDGCTLAAEAVERSKKLAGAHNTEILAKTHCYDAPIAVDKQLFFIAILHVIENAVQYSLRPGLVNIAVARGQQYVRIMVQDRGVGVKPQDAYAIFHPFARGDKAGQFNPDGIGVGLTLARHIIHEFGGTLTWKNRTDSTGSVFTIKLPLAKDL